MKLRNTICMLLAVILIQFFCISPAGASSEPAYETIRFPGTGFEIDFPPASEMEGTLKITSDTPIGAGVRFAMLYYCAVPKEKSGFLAKKGFSFTDEEDALLDGLMPCMFTVLCVENGQTLDDIHPELKEQFQVEKYEKLGSAGEYNFYISYIPDGYQFAQKLSEESMQEFESLIEICRNPDRIRLFEPGKESHPPVVFETVDLNGEKINSEDLFGNHTLTMLNIWTTWCGPCKSELQDLDKLSRNRKLEEKNVASVGIVLDIQNPEDSEMISKARDILSAKDDYSRHAS